MKNLKLDRATLLRLLSGLIVVIAAFGVGRYGAPWTGDSGDQHDHGGAAPTANQIRVWTCAMHPQIKLPKAGQCPICFMDLIALESDDDDEGGLREVSVSPNAAKLMDIETTAVERRFVTADVRMVGKVDYDETRVSYITAWVPGRLDRLFVDYTGVPVQKGDHMVSLYSPELLSAQEELIQAIQATKALGRSDVAIVRETADSTVTAVREKLRLWGLTLEQIEEIEKRGKANDHVTIYAPSGGIVVDKNVQEGMYVNTGTRIYTIADLSRVWINMDAYESDLHWLRYGQHVQFTTESFPGEVFTGSISFIHPVLNEATRTVRVRVNVPNDKGRLKPGMFVRAIAEARVATAGRIMDAALAGKWISPMHPEIIKDEPGACDVCGMPLVRAESLGYVGPVTTADDKPLVIPISAPLRTGKRAIVYVAIPDRDKPTFEGREILLGPRAGDYYIVAQGLQEGERVVTRGAFKLDAELQIRAKPSMMTPRGGGGGGEHAHHGGGTKVAGEMPMSEAGISLPVAVVSKLQDVVSAATAAVDASSGDDFEQMHKAYGVLSERVAVVDRDRLTGHAAMLWQEYSMLLANDGAEGASVRTSAEALALAATAREHMAAMQSTLGIARSPASQTASAIRPEFLQQIGGVIRQYLAVQTALANDDQAAAAAAATEGLGALTKVDMSLVLGQDHVDWMEHAAALRPLLSGVAEATEIEPARAQFSLLSDQVTATLARFGVPDGKLYKAWCPMAFDDRGASWIQDEEEIANPYFGDMMLRCGEIKEVLK